MTSLRCEAQPRFLTSEVAQTERFELPSHEDTGFQIRRYTRLSDVCSKIAKPPASINPFGLKVRKSRVCTKRAGPWWPQGE